MNLLYRYLFVLMCFLTSGLRAQHVVEGLQIAFLADVHLQDIYGRLQDNNYKGVVNPKNGKTVLIRTMEAQLHSTRIFNENYFAFLAALDDIAQRGIRYVALPGDYTDDGQPIHVRGLQRILQAYSEKYNMEFFITTGNHDPVGPFAQHAGKTDFLGKGGMHQPIFSKEGLYKPHGDSELPVVISRDIAKMGYAGIIDSLKHFGFFPKKNDQYWATPFSTYGYAEYTFEKAAQAAVLRERTYEVTPGYVVPDASYVVEPIKGLWLLAIDGNVYIPNASGQADNPKSYQGADLGYNNVLSNKKHLIDWVQKVAAEAKKQHKILIAFSHYPMVEFNDDASGEIEEMMGAGKWQLNRIPKEEVAQTFADVGIKIHFGGHMHLNDTGIRTTKKGNTLVNIQTPSLAAYIPAYKLLTVKNNTMVEVETITIDDVPGFDELFELYRMEHSFLKDRGTKAIWDEAILKTKSYRELINYHLKELVRLRFLPEDWPETFKDFMLNVSGDDLLLLANMKSGISFEHFLTQKIAFKEEQKIAETRAMPVLAEYHLKAGDFKEWKGFDLITDFYRIRNADQLAIADIGEKRIRQYQLLSKCFFENYKVSKFNDQTQKNMGLFFNILDKFLKGAPANHFLINLNRGTVQDIKDEPLHKSRP